MVCPSTQSKYIRSRLSHPLSISRRRKIAIFRVDQSAKPLSSDIQKPQEALSRQFMRELLWITSVGRQQRSFSNTIATFRVESTGTIRVIQPEWRVDRRPIQSPAKSVPTEPNGARRLLVVSTRQSDQVSQPLWRTVPDDSRITRYKKILLP